jgi:hypothetical protein
LKNLFVYCLLAVGLLGCGSGNGGENIQAGTPLSISFNGQNVNQIDHLKDIGLVKFTITNISDKSINIESINLGNDFEDTISRKDTTCINTLSSNQNCVLALNLIKVYTTKQQINVNFSTDRGVVVIPFSVWNYNWMKPSISLDVESDADQKFSYYKVLYKPAGDIRFLLTNTGTSPVFIESINFNTISPYNNIIEASNLCGGTLYESQTCYFTIHYGDLASRYNNITGGLIESFIINYAGGSKFESYSNDVIVPTIYDSANCHNLGICTIYLNNSTSQKIILNDFANLKSTADMEITPTESNGCYPGMTIPQGKSSCNVNFVAKSLPARFNLYYYLGTSFKYYIDESKDLYVNSTNAQESVDIQINAENALSTKYNSPTVPSQCSNYGGKSNVHGWLTLGTVEPNITYHILSTKFTPSATNYTNYISKSVITPSEAILKDGCAGSTVNNNNYCEVDFQSGCQGHGSAGVIEFKYTVDNNPTVFSYAQQLGEIEQPVVEIDVGYLDSFKTVWKTGQPIPSNPIHVNVPPQDGAGFLFGFYNWNTSGSYTIISDNYNKYKTTGVPNCLGNMGLDPSVNFWATGFGAYCGINMDFTNVASGTQVPISLSVGNRGQDTLQFIFDIN